MELGAMRVSIFLDFSSAALGQVSCSCRIVIFGPPYDWFQNHFSTLRSGKLLSKKQLSFSTFCLKAICLSP